MRQPIWVTLTVFGVTSCHLADPPEPPKCEPGFHVEMQRCVEDEIAKNVVTIREACLVEPDPLRVKANEDFQFANEDDERHVVTLLGGKVVEDLGPGQLSRFVAITAPGNFTYEISGCPAGGSIAVE